METGLRHWIHNFNCARHATRGHLTNANHAFMWQIVGLGCQHKPHAAHGQGKSKPFNFRRVNFMARACKHGFSGRVSMFFKNSHTRWFALSEFRTFQPHPKIWKWNDFTWKQKNRSTVSMSAHLLTPRRDLLHFKRQEIFRYAITTSKI